MTTELLNATNEVGPLVRADFVGPVSNGPAQTLIESGVQGLSLLEHRLAGVTTLDRAEALRTREDIVRSRRLNTAAVVAGLAMQAIEDGIETGKFSELDFVVSYGAAVGDFKLDLPALVPNTFRDTPIEPDRHQRMRDLARQDETLADFFNADSFDALPPGMQRLLRESGVLDEIRGQIAPAHKARIKRASRQSLT